jgi:transcriptional regulator with XRE-family HTH domain
MQRFPEKLRALRSRHGMSQNRLAQAIGVTHTHIQRLEQGINKPGAEVVLKLAAYFGLTPNDLLLDEVELE